MYSFDFDHSEMAKFILKAVEAVKLERNFLGNPSDTDHTLQLRILSELKVALESAQSQHCTVNISISAWITEFLVKSKVDPKSAFCPGSLEFLKQKRLVKYVTLLEEVIQKQRGQFLWTSVEFSAKYKRQKAAAPIAEAPVAVGSASEFQAVDDEGKEEEQELPANNVESEVKFNKYVKKGDFFGANNFLKDKVDNFPVHQLRNLRVQLEALLTGQKVSLHTSNQENIDRILGKQKDLMSAIVFHKVEVVEQLVGELHSLNFVGNSPVAYPRRHIYNEQPPAFSPSISITPVVCAMMQVEGYGNDPDSPQLLQKRTVLSALLGSPKVDVSFEGGQISPLCRALYRNRGLTADLLARGVNPNHPGGYAYKLAPNNDGVYEQWGCLVAVRSADHPVELLLHVAVSRDDNPKELQESLLVLLLQYGACLNDAVRQRLVNAGKGGTFSKKGLAALENEHSTFRLKDIPSVSKILLDCTNLPAALLGVVYECIFAPIVIKAQAGRGYGAGFEFFPRLLLAAEGAGAGAADRSQEDDLSVATSRAG